MSFLNINLDDTKEPTVAEAGEHVVRIAMAEAKKSKAGADMLVLTIELPNEVGVGRIFDYLLAPQESDDDNRVYMRKLSLNRMCECFGYDSTNGGIDTEELIGREGKALISIEDNEEYGEQNRIKRYISA